MTSFSNPSDSLTLRIERPNLPTEENERRIGKIYSANLGGVKGYYLWGGNLQNSILIIFLLFFNIVQIY